MRYFLLLILLVCIITRTVTRPSRSDQEVIREAENERYDNNEESPGEEDSLQEDEEASLNEEESELGQDEEPVRGDDPAGGQQLNRLDKANYNTHAFSADHAGRPRNEHVLDYSLRDKDEKTDEETLSNNGALLQKGRQSERYIENSYTRNGLESTEHLTIARNRMQDNVHNNELNERTIDTRRNANSESLYDNQGSHKNNVDNSEYHKDIPDSNESSRQFKQFSNTMESDYKNMVNDRNYEMAKYIINRERRQIEPNSTLLLSSTSTEKESSLSEATNEDDEAAIKRHIKKLSGEELEELLNSLSEEKKALLNKIMDNNQNYDSLNKREITKKAGAVEENSYMETGLSELSKLQGGSSSVDVNTESAVVHDSDTETTKQEIQTESSDISNTKIPETTRGETADNKAKFSDEATNIDSKVNENSKSLLTSDKQSVKSESKRHANFDYFKEDDSFDDSLLSENYLNMINLAEPFNEQDCSQDEDSSRLLNKDAQIHANQEFKREVLLDEQTKLDDSIKSLEESFPKSDCEESGQYLESNMAPLIRVKRKDENCNIQKKPLGVLSDSKVAYVPYKAENEDVDNDEGSEFDEDGFYDRTANYARNDPANDDSDQANSAFDPFEKKRHQRLLDKETAELVKGSVNKINRETMSLGSDTDNVLSGIEGVDDNLMYSSGNRNRRTVQDNLEHLTVMKVGSRNLRSTPVADDAAKTLDTHINLPNFQENDAFGALPRSYDGDLGRYKRIRRVKSSAEVSSE